MDRLDASSFDDVGGRAVTVALDRLAPSLGFTHLDGLMIDVGSHVVRYDNILIDSRGLLVIEAKVRTGAIVHGRSQDAHWIAVFPGGRRLSFDNPLIRARSHTAQLVQKLIEKTGDPRMNVPTDDLIVFTGANISNLNLNPEDKGRVITLDGLDEKLRTRAESAESVTPVDQTRLDHSLRNLDGSNDPDVRARYERRLRALREKRRSERLSPDIDTTRLIGMALLFSCVLVTVGLLVTWAMLSG